MESLKKEGKKGHWTPFPSSINQEALDCITKQFEPRDSDVWVVSFPKSGTTWCTDIVSHVVFDEANAAPLGGGIALGLTDVEHVPWMEAICGKSKDGPEDFVTKVNALPKNVRRCFKSHAPYDYLIQWTAPKSKIIYVARNPKDVAVSLWHHSRSKKSFEYEGPFSHFLEKVFLPGRAESGGWWEHVGMYISKANWSSIVGDGEDSGMPEIFCLWYEDILGGAAEAVEGIANFLDIKISKDKATEISQACSFNSMKESEKSKGCAGVNMESGDGYAGSLEKFSASHIRKGGVGGWKHYFTVAQNERFDKFQNKYSEILRGQGITINYGDSSSTDEIDEVLGALEDQSERTCAIM